MADGAEDLPPTLFLEQFTLPSGVERAFGDYTKTAEAARAMQDTMSRIESFITLVNYGQLPPGYMVMTETETAEVVSIAADAWKDELRRTHAPEHGTIIYRPNPDPNIHRFVPDGEIVTWGSTRHFLGDYFDRIDGNLVLINNELQVGINVHGVVKMVKSSEYEKKFLDHTMPYIERVSGGEKQSFDLGR